MKRTHCAIATFRAGIARLAFVLAGVLLGTLDASALNPDLDIKQYAHTAWKSRDGFFKGEISSFAQTADGYLWIGTWFGIVRFDGMRFTPWQPPGDEPLPSAYVMSLLAAHDGTLWIGTTKGVASWKDGKLTTYPELADQMVLNLLEDHDGAVWVGGLSVTPDRKVCAITGKTVQCSPLEDAHGVVALHEDRNGELWVGVTDGVWRWKSNPRKFYSLPGEADGIRAIGEGDRGEILAGWRGGISVLDENGMQPNSFPTLSEKYDAKRLWRDRDGGLWIAAQDHGLFHTHQGRATTYRHADGLTGDSVNRVFEDREGNIWVSTNAGLDRFRDYAIATLSADQGLLSTVVGSVLADPDGTIWIATLEGLNKWKNGQVSAYGTHKGKLNGHAALSLFRDSRGRIWVATIAEVGYLAENDFSAIPGVPAGIVHGMAEDAAGNVWIANQESGLIEVTPGHEVRKIPWASLRRYDDFATVLRAVPGGGGIWLGFQNGGVAYIVDGQVWASYSADDGLAAGRVADFYFDRQGALWIATEGGLSQLLKKRIATLSSKNGLPCDAVHWTIQDNSGMFWLETACGLLRVEPQELERRLEAAGNHRQTAGLLSATTLDQSDGLIIRPDSGGFGALVTLAADGKLWFINSGEGVSVIDPRRISVNKDPPPVHVEQVIADRQSYDALTDAGKAVSLPPLVHDIEIDYTALSLVAPEKNQFRYMLEGYEKDWENVGARRQAFYNDLPPGDYRFRVVASNNSGVWNEQGAALGFSIAPAWWQTIWFRALCVVLAVAMVAVLFQLRMRQLTRRYRENLAARVGERTRIARELHDTLLQSFQGALLLFQTVYEMLPGQPNAAKVKLAGAIELSATAITEGRDAVQGLRSSVAETNDLALAIKTAGEDLVAEQPADKRPAFQVGVQGAAQPLHPLVRDEIVRITGEALRNAFHHARASKIEVDVRYDARMVRLRVRDDGTGIDPKVVSEGPPEGHYGLRGMRERAQLIGGKLTIWSGPNSGTEVELAVPAARAYAPSERSSASAG